MITWILPEKKWYFAALSLTNFILFFKKRKLKATSKEFVRAQLLNRFLAFMTRTQKEFPIPYTLNGIEFLSDECGIILCSVHIPLVKVTLRGILDNKKNIDAAIVGAAPASNSMAVWGIIQKVPIIIKNPFALVKAKSVLEKKGTLVLMIDHPQTGEYSPNIFKLCRKIDAKVVYFFAVLKSDNTIDSFLIEAPNPRCQSLEQIQENLDFLKVKHTEILAKYSN